MGSSVSVHKNPESAMKFRFSIGSKTKNLSIPSPTKEKPANGEHPIAEFAFKSQSSPLPPVTTLQDFGSKEETFFDSQAWLESDCEDDFLSVNGDFTPSRGSTPNHQSSFTGIPQIKSLFMDRRSESNSEPSPNDKKKKLSDLFRESLRGEEVIDDQNIADNRNTANGKIEIKPTNLDDLHLKSTNGTPYVSGANSACSSERTPNRNSKPGREKLARVAQCCLPSLVPSFSFNERKKRLSPGRTEDNGT